MTGWGQWLGHYMGNNVFHAPRPHDSGSSRLPILSVIRSIPLTFFSPLKNVYFPEGHIVQSALLCAFLGLNSSVKEKHSPKSADFTVPAQSGNWHCSDPKTFSSSVFLNLHWVSLFQHEDILTFVPKCIYIPTWLCSFFPSICVPQHTWHTTSFAIHISVFFFFFFPVIHTQLIL